MSSLIPDSDRVHKLSVKDSVDKFSPEKFICEIPQRPPYHFAMNGFLIKPIPKELL